MKKKKILIISPIFPYPLKSGGQVRIFNVIKHLSNNFEVSLLALIEKGKEEYVAKIKEFCKIVETVPVQLYENNFVKMVSLIKFSQFPRTIKRLFQWIRGIPFHICRFYHLEMLEKLEKMILSDKYDIVNAEYSQMAPYLKKAKEMDRNIKTVLVDIDLSFIVKYREYLTQKGAFRLFSAIEYKRINDYVIKMWPSFDKIIVISELDKKKLLALNPGINISVIPNGVDISYFKPINHQIPKNKLAFLGGSLHYPNVDALKYFHEEIFPKVRQSIGDIPLIVIGEFANNLIPEANNYTNFTGYVDDFRPYLNECSLLIVPLRIGGGSRLKILEAMALGIPVVSTSIGCEGIEVENGRNIIIADNPHEFVEGIKSILRDESLYKTLAENGRHLVEQKYSWQYIVSQLEEIYQKELLHREDL